MNIIKEIEIVPIINAILVNENVRPAMLVQPADYKEAKGTDKKTLSIVNRIKNIFPDLVLSDNYYNYQGTIISKKSYDNKFISLDEMGKILGYPCYKGFEKINRENILTSISIMVSYNNNSVTKIIANVCKDKRTLKKFNLIATKAYDILTNKKYANILQGIKINDVYVDVQNKIPTQFIINKLMTNKKISTEENDEISNILYNKQFSDNLYDYEFQYNNKIHKGILLNILLNTKYDILSPFYPIQDYPTEQKEVDEIIINLENGLIEVLNKTKTKTKK